MRRATLAGMLLCLVACRGTLSPLSNKLKVGEEAYLVFSAPGEDGVGDLFASATVGGAIHQVTFSRVDERLPALAPDGVMLAFTRSRLPGDTVAVHVVVMNLLNGKERRIEGELGGPPAALAWSDDGATLYARPPSGVQAVAAPPAAGTWQASPVGDSVFAVRVGQPVFGVVTGCADSAPGDALCIRLPSDSLVPLAPSGVAPARWRGDSVAYRDGDDWVVRPLAGGKARLLRWTRTITPPAALTVYPGPQ